MPERIPSVFFGHGSPMNALARNAYAEGWASIGSRLPRPKAILMVSAHWFVPSTAVTVAPKPQMIYDFQGFPRELYQVDYPAPGSPALAERVIEVLAPSAVERDANWGLDHGTWAVLCHVFPDAGIPVVQLSVNRRLAPQAHFELGKQLAPLREEGVLVAGSGNVVHNLREYAWGQDDAPPYDWAVSFEQRIREALVQGDSTTLAGYLTLGPEAMRSVPTPEHYLPLLYVAATRKEGEAVSFPVEGIDGGSISMLSVQVG